MKLQWIRLVNNISYSLGLNLCRTDLPGEFKMAVLVCRLHVQIYSIQLHTELLILTFEYPFQ